MKRILLITWSFLTTVAFFFSPTESKAQFREEIATLESVYESRARAVLNSFLRPNDYSIVVSADIRRDEKKLDVYRETLEMNFLPGMAGVPGPEMLPAQNMLHDLKNKVDIHLVISDSVTPEKEKLLKSVLTSKLHLDESNGDTLVVERTIFPNSGLDEKAPLLPEFTWKTWGLIVLLALLALAAVVFWATRRRPEAAKARKEKEEEKDQAPPQSDKGTTEDLEELLGLEAAKETQVSTAQMKEQVLALATQYPQISTKALLEHFSTGHENEVVLLFESLGWDVARKVFTDMPSRVWGRIGAIVRDRVEMPKEEDFRKALGECYRIILSRFLESGADRDENNPFSFIFKLSVLERERLLANESATNLALISVYCPAREMGELFESLPTSVQNEVAVAIARLEMLPESAVKAASMNLKHKLSAIQAQPEISAQGANRAASLLRNLPALREMELFERMLTENPNEADRIRRINVQFTDLSVYPENIVGEALADIDVSVLVFALNSASQELFESIIRTLPPKKGKMVDKDVTSGVITPTKAQCAEARRQIAMAVERSLSNRQISLDDLWNQIDKASSAAA